MSTTRLVRTEGEIKLPVPASSAEMVSPDRFSREDRGEAYVLTPRSLISIAFNRQPSIKSSFHRFKVEEARLDFFYASRDSLTPHFSTSNALGESREEESVAREREHTLELGIERRFFDTTQLDVAAGFKAGALDEAIGYRPYVSADLRYPLWVSREKLERTSEEIFRRNEFDDAQLAYIQEVRWSLQFTLFRFYETVQQRRLVNNARRWLGDLEVLLEKLGSVEGRDVTADRSRVEAETAKVTAEVRNLSGRFDVLLERLKAECGLPFHARVDLVEDSFNPFEGMTHDELFRLSVETDPEIETLRNSERNAEAQLDLARRGRWDLALLLSGSSNLEGAGEEEGVSDWSVSAGLNVSAVDPRVTDSLIRQAEANIARFSQAIAARENAIFVDTFEPLIRIETLSKSRDELLGNLSRYEDDYRVGVEAYLAGRLNVDDLLKRREDLHEQEEDIAGLIYLVGANVAELCAATGKFFELLDGDDAEAEDTNTP